MELSIIESLIPDLAGLLGIESSTALLILGLVVAIANLAGRLIPDEATGVLGFARKASKFIGLYASNRVTATSSVNEVVKGVLDSQITPKSRK